MEALIAIYGEEDDNVKVSDTDIDKKKDSSNDNTVFKLASLSVEDK